MELLLQKLNETNERIQNHHKGLRKIALKISSRLNPTRYENTQKILLDRARLSRDLAISSHIKDDIDTTFLMGLTDYKSDFKPLNVYNVNKSVTLKPTQNFIKNLFKVRFY